MVGNPFKTLFCIGLLAQIAVVQASVPETLSYRVYYKGLLSAMSEVPIAEAQLITERPSATLEVSTLTLSSAAHDVVDALYPIRYRLRALYDLGDQRLVGAERFKRTREVKHDLTWLDAADGRLRYVRADAGAPLVSVPEPLRPWMTSTRLHGAIGDPVVVPQSLLDRLSLLQSLRRHIPPAGQVVDLPVVDGRKAYRYEVRLDGIESLSLAGKLWDTWRLRVEGYERTAQGGFSDQPEHAPIFVWISRDAQRLPLQFRVDHAVGDFTVAWVPGTLPVDIATAVPQAQDAWGDDG